MGGPGGNFSDALLTLAVAVFPLNSRVRNSEVELYGLISMCDGVGGAAGPLHIKMRAVILSPFLHNTKPKRERRQDRGSVSVISRL